MTTREVSREKLLFLLETMWLINTFDEKASEIYAGGKINGILHLGMEGAAAVFGDGGGRVRFFHGPQNVALY